MAQGATTVLAVLDGVKAVYDHHQIGKDIGDLKSDLNNAQKVKIVAEFVGHDDLLRTVDRSAMVNPIPVPEGVSGCSSYQQRGEHCEARQV